MNFNENQGLSLIVIECSMKIKKFHRIWLSFQWKSCIFIDFHLISNGNHGFSFIFIEFSMKIMDVWEDGRLGNVWETFPKRFPNVWETFRGRLPNAMQIHDFHWNSNENQWKPMIFIENSMEINEKQWFSLKIQWKLMRIHYFHWKSNENHWKLMIFNENPMKINANTLFPSQICKKRRCHVADYTKRFV